MLKRKVPLLLWLFFLCRVTTYYAPILLGDRELPEDNPGSYVKYGHGGQGEEPPDIFMRIRMGSAVRIQKYLPSPHSELLIGMLLGKNELNKNPTFTSMLRTTGTIHVVVVSGYNISLMYGMVIRVLGSPYVKKNLITAIFFTFMYAVVTGFEPPVVRAWIMGSVTAWGKFYGRSLEALRVLMFSAMVMVMIEPSYLTNLSFQLSFLATYGVTKYSELFTVLLNNVIKVRGQLISDLASTLAAQLLVWPLISYTFGQISIIGPVVNCLILWAVPLSTVMGGVLLLFSYTVPFPAVLFAFVVFVPLDIFVRTVFYFGEFSYSQVIYQVGLGFVVIYIITFVLIPAHRICGRFLKDLKN